MKSRLISALFIATLSSFFLPLYAANVTHQTKQSESKIDGEVLNWVVILNKNEISAAKQTIKRKLNPIVISYAQLMIKEHTKNLQETLALSRKLHIKLIPSDESAALQEKGKQELVDLKSLKGNDYQTTYINAMVKGHTEALDQIEERLKVVRNPQLIAQLKSTESHVRIHLEKAKAIQNQLG